MAHGRCDARWPPIVVDDRWSDARARLLRARRGDSEESVKSEHFDVVIVGAGLSGIGAAVHLRRALPHKRFILLEARDAIGGTWDLFRYPGIRSDSDMFTLGYSFKPWKARKAIADGPSILAYLRETARENALDDKIRLRHRVTRASWSSAEARWTLEVERGDTGERLEITANFLWSNTGYYDYEKGYEPPFPGRERFKGRVVHPQAWTEDIDYDDQRVIVIGSGATAVTLVPALAARARHVVMLQRSPTWMISRPAVDAVAEKLRATLPEKLAYDLTRWKNVLLQMTLYQLSRRRPTMMSRWLLDEVRRHVGPEVDLSDFTPKYNPWDERLCLVPDADFFRAVREGRAEIVTDTIERFTEEGIALTSGRHLEADLIVTATGLVLKFAGGVDASVDGKPIVPSELVSYRGCMFSEVPNYATTFGYTNASWTLKADLIADFVVRVLREADKRGAKIITPRLNDPSVRKLPFVDLQSGYFKRAIDALPRQGDRGPWRLNQNYLRDLALLRWSKLDDGALEFSTRASRTAPTVGEGPHG
jgi:monooxygenase